MIDEMSIKRQITWVPSDHKGVGYVHLGGQQRGIDTEIGTNALVLMAVGMKKKWQLPLHSRTQCRNTICSSKTSY